MILLLGLDPWPLDPLDPLTPATESRTFYVGSMVQWWKSTGRFSSRTNYLRPRKVLDFECCSSLLAEGFYQRLGLHTIGDKETFMDGQGKNSYKVGPYQL